MPYPINSLDRLLLEDGTSYLLLDEASPHRITSQDASNTGITSVVGTYPATPTQNNTLIACVYNSDPSASVSMSAGWTLAVGSDDTGGHSASIWYKVAGAAEPTGVTASDGASGSMHITLFEYKGLLSVSPKDQTASANSGAATANSQTTGTTSTTTQANELLIAAVAFAGSGSAPSWTNGFNAQLSTSRIFVADKLVSATGTYSSTVTVTGTAVKMAGAIATFKAIDNTTDKIIIDEATALDDPVNAASVSTLTPALTFSGQSLPGFLLSDPFNAATLDTTKWTQFTAASGTCTYTTSGASLNYPNPTSTSNDADITSVSTFDLTGNTATLQVLNAPSGANSDATFKLKIDATHDVHWQQEGTNLFAAYVNGSQSTLATLTYNATIHRWWRIRESGGTTYWDTSADGANWTQQASVANPISLTKLFVQMAATSFGADSGLTAFKFNNFSIKSLTYELQIDTQPFNSTFYFDGSDAAATDPNAVWTNDANAFDGDLSTTASSQTTGSTASNYLMAEGTNAPISGGTIGSVRARINGVAIGPTSANNDITAAAVYTNGLAELLGTAIVADGSSTNVLTKWSDYVTLSTPSGGWTWQKVNDLEVKIYTTAIGGAYQTGFATKVEVEVIPLLDVTSDANTGFIDVTAGETSEPLLLLEDGTSHLLLEDGTSRLALNEIYPAGNYVTYTVPSGTLTNGLTYYWRVRNKVQNGGNYPTAWSETRSFTISAGSVITTTQLAIARIANIVTKTQGAIARIAATVTKTQAAIARISNSRTTTQPAISRISNIVTKIQSSISRIATIPTKTQPATARIQRTLTKTQPAISRIANLFTKTQPSIARISQIYTKTQTAISRIQNTVTKTQSAIARIQKNFIFTQSAIARIAGGSSKTQTAIAHITATVTKTQGAIARIQRILTKTQPATARIAQIYTKTQGAIARIATVRTLTQSAVANIINSTTSTKNQTAIARIANIVTKTQPAISRIANITTKTQPALARIANVVTKTQTAIARIAKTVTKTQASISRIANTVTKTQPAVSRVATNLTKTQSSIAKIIQASGSSTITQRIEMCSGAFNTSGTANTYFEIPAIATRLDSAAFDGTVTFYFEASLVQGGTTGQTAYAELYNHTDGVSVTSSQVTSTVNDGFPQYLRSSAITLSGDKIYTVRLKHSNTTTASTIYAARIVVVQSGTITKTQIHHDLSSEQSTASTSSTNLLSRFAPFLYEASKYDGTVTVRHDANVKTTASNTVTSGIYDITAASVVSSSEVTKTNDTNYSVLSSANITLTDGHVYTPTAYVSAGTGVFFESNKLVFTLTNFSKFLAYMLITAPGSFSPQANSTDNYPTFNAWVGTNPVFDTANDFTGCNLTTYFESNIAINDIAKTAYGDLEVYVHATSATSISGTTVSHTGDTLNTRVRSASFTMPSGFNELNDGISASLGTNTATRTNSYLILEVTGVSSGITITTQPAIARIATNRTFTQSSIARIATIRSLTQPSTARISQIYTKTQGAAARIAKTVTKTQSAIAKIASTVTKTQTATARIQTLLTKTQSAIARISQSSTKTQSAVARIANLKAKTQPAISRIANSLTKTQPAISRIANATTKTQGAISRIQKNLTLTQSAVANIIQNNVSSKTQTATAHITAVVNKTQSAVAKIATNLTKTQGATARISQLFTKTQPAVARISNTVTKTQSAVARIAKTVTKTQTALARIANNQTKLQTAIARISNIVTKTQTAVSRIANSFTKTQSAVARVARNFTFIQSAVARIANLLTKTQTAIARISNGLTKTQGAIARISLAVTKTQPGTARIAKQVTKAQSATANINQGSTKIQTAVARIAKTLTKVQTAVAAIVTTSTKTQLAKARISKSFTKTQSATARIYATDKVSDSVTLDVFINDIDIDYEKYDLSLGFNDRLIDIDQDAYNLNLENESTSLFL